MVLEQVIAAFWQKFCKDSGFQGPVANITCFGDDREMQNQLCNLVLSGRKRATASLAMWYGPDGQSMPNPGDLSIMLDGEGTPRGVIQTTEVCQGPFASVDARFAADEGEGDGSLDYWKTEHQRYFTSELSKDSIPFSETIQVVFERFILVWSPS
jgi:uncharacterized protein YhfF